MGFPSDWPGLAAGKRLPYYKWGIVQPQSERGPRQARNQVLYLVSDTLQMRMTKTELTLPTGDYMAGPAALPSSSFHKENYMVGGGSQEIAFKGFSPLAT